MNPLDQLRDIHNAPAPSWWPPAPGWWMLALVLAVLAFYLLRLALRQWRKRRDRQRILGLFEAALPAFDQHGDRRRLAMDLDLLMRRLALLRFSPQAASASGEAWLRVWHCDAGDPMARLMLQAPYQAQPDFDPAALHGWVMQRVRPHV